MRAVPPIPSPSSPTAARVLGMVKIPSAPAFCGISTMNSMRILDAPLAFRSRPMGRHSPWKFRAAALAAATNSEASSKGFASATDAPITQSWQPRNATSPTWRWTKSVRPFRQCWSDSTPLISHSLKGDITTTDLKSNHLSGDPLRHKIPTSSIIEQQQVEHPTINQARNSVR